MSLTPKEMQLLALGATKTADSGFDWSSAGTPESDASGFDWGAAEKPAEKHNKTPLSVGAGETFLNKTASALPLGAQVVGTGAGLLRKALGLGSPSIHVNMQPGDEELLRQQGFEMPEGKSLSTHMREARDQFAQRTEAGAKENHLAALGGTVLGTGLSLAAPLPKVGLGGKQAGVGMRILNNALTAAGYGALNGGANSKGDLYKGEVGQVLGDAVGVDGLKQAYEDAKAGNYGHAALDTMGAGAIGGGLTGGLLGGAVEGVKASGILPKAAASMKSFANRKALNALGAMKPELNALGSEAANELGAYALEKGVVSPLASRATMAERVEGLRKSAGDRLSGALQQTDAAGETIDRVSAAARIEAEADKLAKQPALKGIADKFRQQAEAIRSSPGPQRMSVSEFEKDVVRPYKQTTNWNDNLALPKATLQKLSMALEAEVEGAASRGGGLAEYSAGKKDYGKLAELRDIAEEGLKRQASNHTFGLKDIGIAGSMAAGGMHHGALGSAAYGVGGLLVSKLANRFGDQMSAKTFDALARAIQGGSGPQSPGQTAAILSEILRQPMRLPSTQFAGSDSQGHEQYASKEGR